MLKSLLTLALSLFISSTVFAANFKVSSACLKKLSEGENRMKAKLPMPALKVLARNLADKNMTLQEDAVALVVDYTKSSREKRAYFVDFKACDVLTEDYVAHGGAYMVGKRAIIDGDPNRDGMLDKCINRKGTRTNMTRPGLYITNGCHDTKKNWTTVQGECNGVKLIGLEKRNEDAMTAGVVLHEMRELVEDDSIKVMGQGCPAFASGRLKNLIRYGIMNDTLVYVYAPQCD